MAVSAGMILDALSPAMGAAVEVPSQRGGAAVKEVGYDSVLIRRERISILIVFQVLVEDIR